MTEKRKCLHNWCPNKFDVIRRRGRPQRYCSKECAHFAARLAELQQLIHRAVVEAPKIAETRTKAGNICVTEEGRRHLQALRSELFKLANTINGAGSQVELEPGRKRTKTRSGWRGAHRNDKQPQLKLVVTRRPAREAG